MQSMTGYGRAEAAGEGYSVAVELKSVNNRFLEFQCKTSRNILHLEPRMKQALGNHVARGSITCHVQYDSFDSSQTGFALNEPLFTAYVEMAKTMQARLGAYATLDVASLLKIPEMVTAAAVKSEPPELLEARVMPVFEKACLALVAMREREGKALAGDLEGRIRGFYPALEKVKTLLPERQAEYAAKMRARVKELLGGAPLQEDRLLTEIGLMAERLDVTEEIVRLEAHLPHFQETMEEHKAPGKALGFLLQEMLREVNTLGTKSQYSDIQRICIGWKEELEIIREQIQNIE